MAVEIVAKPTIVASFTEAWIEIFGDSAGTAKVMVASFTEAWIEIITLIG